MTIREFGSEKRFMGAPAASSKAAIEAASPTQVVTTSGRKVVEMRTENLRCYQRECSEKDRGRKRVPTGVTILASAALIPGLRFRVIRLREENR